MKKDIIEKGRTKINHNVGDVNPNKPNEVWTEYQSGKFDWRRKVGNSDKPSENKTSNSDKPSVDKPSVDKPIINKPPVDNTSDYKPKKAKVVYKNAPTIRVIIPSQWTSKLADGTIVKRNREDMIKMIAKKSDSDLIKYVSNHRINYKLRQIAYDEAASRGIDEDKIDVEGTLKDQWIKDKELAKQVGKIKPTIEDEGVEEDYNVDLKGFDIKDFMSQFPNGDTGWDDENDKRVQQTFNKLTTLVDRQKYDTFLDIQKRSNPNYMNVKEEIQDLNAEYFNFLTGDSSPMLISSGGAGVGKTYGLNIMAKYLNYKFLDQNQNPEDGDWTIVKCPNPKSEKEFLQMLKMYNGEDDNGNKHILVFDDHDSILTSKQYNSTMKTIADSDPDSRLFKDPETGKMIKFTSKILVITNKNQNALMNAAGDSSEDLNALFSRATKKDIHFTVNENLELLKDRYKTMKISGLNMNSNDEMKAREEVYNFIVDNKDKIDPRFFTVRKFSEAMNAIAKDYKVKNVQDNAVMSDLVGKKVDWKSSVLQMLKKGEEIDIIKGDFFEQKMKDLPKNTKKLMIKMNKDNPEMFKKLFGDKVLKIISDDSDDENDNVEKSFDDSMTIKEAEELILSK